MFELLNYSYKANYLSLNDIQLPVVISKHLIVGFDCNQVHKLGVAKMHNANLI